MPIVNVTRDGRVAMAIEERDWMPIIQGERQQQGQDRRVIAIADKAHQRLARRFRRLSAIDKPKNKVCVAGARELAAFMWSAMQEVRPAN